MGEPSCKFNIELVKLICGCTGVESMFLVDLNFLVGSDAFECPVENWLDAVLMH